MTAKAFNQGLFEFLDNSPTPFHATANMRASLLASGFEELRESDTWDLKAGKPYFVVRNDSAIIAFRLGADRRARDGMAMAGAHTDSPCLKLKPQALNAASGYLRFGVEVYGGVLLNPWFDRDLSLAGRVSVRNSKGALSNHLIDFEKPIAIIPSLAIHLDRDANKSRSINNQTMLPAIISLAGKGKPDFNAMLLKQLGAQGRLPGGAEVMDFDLSLYGTEQAGFVGINSEFIAGARLDNLLSCYAGLRAIADTKSKQACLLVCNDHEEVGSGSTAGARGGFLESVLRRIAGDDEAYAQLVDGSLLMSTDNAHGVHPNFADKHEPAHGPMLNAGPVLKFNANQAYASNGESAAIIRALARKAKIPLQSFVVRSDMGCGSTIGPLTATRIGMRTIDIGVPTFAMHSIRELAGSKDATALCKLLGTLFSAPNLAVQAVS